MTEKAYFQKWYPIYRLIHSNLTSVQVIDLLWQEYDRAILRSMENVDGAGI